MTVPAAGLANLNLQELVAGVTKPIVSGRYWSAFGSIVETLFLYCANISGQLHITDTVGCDYLSVPLIPASSTTPPICLVFPHVPPAKYVFDF